MVEVQETRLSLLLCFASCYHKSLTPPQSSFAGQVIIVHPLASLEETANLQKAPCHNLCITKREMKTAEKRSIMAAECTHTRSRRVLYQTAPNC